MFSSPDNQRIFGLIAAATFVSVVFGVSLESATFEGEALGAQVYIGGPAVGFFIQLYIFDKFNLFKQGLTPKEDDLFSIQFEALNSVEEIENMIIDLEGELQRITNKINRAEQAKANFNAGEPRSALLNMGMTLARRGG